NERWGVAPSISIGLNTATTATLSYLHFEENNLPSYGVPFVTTPVNPFGGEDAVGKPAPVPNKTFYGLVNRDYEDITNDIASLRFEHSFGDSSRLENTFRYGRTFRDSIIAAPRIFSASSSDSITRELQARYQTDEIIASQTTYTTQFETLGLKHSFVASLDYSNEREENKLRANTVIAQRGDAYNPNPYDPIGVYGFTGAKNESASDSLGLAVFDAITIGEQWILNLGARYDYFDATYDQTAVNQTVTTFQTTDEKPTWRAGLVFKPLPNGSIYFNYGTSFNPSAEGLTLTALNENLDPETSESFELGTKWDLFGEKLSLTGAIFRTDKTNYRTTDPVTAIVSTTGEVRVEGIQFGVAGNIAKNWSVFGGYTYLDSEILSSTTVSSGIPEVGHELSNTPHHTGSLWTTYKLPYHIEIGTGVQYVGERYANNINDRAADGYWLQDAMISWQASKNVTVQVNVTNLWNEEYIDRLGGGHAIPGAGRSVILSTGVRF
ncbi:MAG: TonB-dependent receptor, partial [Opitutaceae bacterium]|nr:TonB-dependent receptor [Verrucomicrobiales bacterium]